MKNTWLISQKIEKPFQNEGLCLRSEHLKDAYLCERYIRKNEESILKLYAEKLYLSKLQKVLSEELRALNMFKNAYYPVLKYDVYDGLPEQIKECVTPLFESTANKIDTWYGNHYQKNSFPIDEYNRYTTRSGEYVRSRAECITADIIDELNLKYHYEEALKLDNNLVFPDFTIAHPRTGELYYMELFGMMGEEEYAKSAYRKIAQYTQAGYAARLLYVFDYPGVPFSPECVRKMLNSVFHA